MDIVTLGAALNGSAEYVNSHFKGGSNIQIVDNPDGTQTINASGEVSSEDTVARAEIAAIKDGETLDSFGDVETALGDKADTSTTYTKTEVDTALGGKVDKETGKGLSTNDYTTAEKTKLDYLAEIKSIGTGLNLDSTTGELTATGGGGGGTTNYNDLSNKPQINSVTLSGNKSLSDIGALPNTTTYAGSSTVGGSATSAAKLDTNAGSGTQPVYFSNGVPTATTYALNKTVPSDAVFTDTTYESKTAASGGTDVSLCTTGEKYTWNSKQNAIDSSHKLSADLVDDTSTTNKFATAEELEQIQTNKNNISSIQQEQIVQNNDIATLREITNCKLYGFKIDKQDVNPDTRVTYLYDAIGMTPAYMDFDGGSFNYGSWADIWFIKNNRPVALKFDGTVDYELSHTDFTKKLDGTASDIEDSTYAGNFMSEIPLIYVKRWEDSRYNYIVFSETKPNDDYLAQAHTNANGTVNPYIYLPMFKGWKDSNNKLRSLMGTYPTGNTKGTNEVTCASNCGTGWQLWDKAKIDLIMDLIVLITKSTNCRAKIGNGDCQTYNASDTTTYGKMKSGYETDGTTRSTNAQFYGSEGTEVTNYGKHHMIAFYIEDLWANRWDRCLGFNLINNVYKVKMVAPYTLDSDSSYETLTVSPPSAEGWLKNVSSANAYGDVPTEVDASNTTGFANYFYKNASGSSLSLFGGRCDSGLRVGRYWDLSGESGISYWRIGGSPCYNSPS